VHISKGNKSYLRGFITYNAENISLIKQYLLTWKSAHSELFAWVGYLIKISPIWRKFYWFLSIW